MFYLKQFFARFKAHIFQGFLNDGRLAGSISTLRRNCVADPDTHAGICAICNHWTYVGCIEMQFLVEYASSSVFRVSHLAIALANPSAFRGKFPPFDICICGLIRCNNSSPVHRIQYSYCKLVILPSIERLADDDPAYSIKYPVPPLAVIFEMM